MKVVQTCPKGSTPTLAGMTWPGHTDHGLLRDSRGQDCPSGGSPGEADRAPWKQLCTENFIINLHAQPCFDLRSARAGEGRWVVQRHPQAGKVSPETDPKWSVCLEGHSRARVLTHTGFARSGGCGKRKPGGLLVPM